MVSFESASRGVGGDAGVWRGDLNDFLEPETRIRCQISCVVPTSVKDQNCIYIRGRTCCETHREQTIQARCGSRYSLSPAAASPRDWHVATKLPRGVSWRGG